jgi:S-adenosylmethionine synthetase
MKTEYVFTSESVTCGHPDKLCDQISDAIVGRLLRRDRVAKVVAECATSAGIVFVSLRFLSEASVDISTVARSVIRQVGYDHEQFNPRTCAIMTSVIGYPHNARAPEDEGQRIADQDLDRLPVSDQATVFGFACRHTDQLMPLPVWLANRLSRELDHARQSGDLPFLSPDGKVQVAVEFKERIPTRIHSISIVAGQNQLERPTAKQLEEALHERVIARVFSEERVKPDARTRIAINPDGPLLYGGPHAHAGLTGRKSGADMYGEFARQSNASLSGKDPSRIDRVAVYAARHAAKSVVAAGLADECEVQLSYSIGLAAPVSVQVETFGTAKRDVEDIAKRVRRNFDFRLGAIVRDYRLRDLPATSDDGFYVKLAAYGHLGRPELELPWESLDRVPMLLG